MTGDLMTTDKKVSAQGVGGDELKALLSQGSLRQKASPGEKRISPTTCSNGWLETLILGK
jgi:hypothetical protein